MPRRTQVKEKPAASGWEAEYDVIRALMPRRLGLLRFPEPLESAVRAYIAQRALATLRDSLWLVVLLYLVSVVMVVNFFGLGDGFADPHDLRVSTWLFGINGLAILMVALCIRWQRLDSWYFTYVAAAAGIAVVSMIMAPSLFHEQALRQHVSYFAIYVLMILYGVSNMRMVQSAIIGFGGLAIAVAVLMGTNRLDDLVNLFQYGLLANLVGLGNAYVLEVRDRRLFLQARLLELEKRQLNRLSERLVQLAREDGLTQLANRRHFNDSFLVEWERGRRERQPLSLVFVDVDHFKAYNDNHGHLEGDRALAAVAATMKPLARRPGDLAARYGGEEFVLLLPNTAAEGARELAEELVQAVDARAIPHRASSVGPHVTVSVGVATVVPDVHLAPARLIDAADGALYAAKQGGRHQVRVADQV